MAEHEYLQVETTTESRDEAASLASSIISARLAACAQVVGPITSSYWWQGEVAQDEEFLILIKTASDRYDALATHISERHSYDEPEIIATPITAGSRSFLDWISDETRPAATS